MVCWNISCILISWIIYLVSCKNCKSILREWNISCILNDWNIVLNLKDAPLQWFDEIFLEYWKCELRRRTKLAFRNHIPHCLEDFFNSAGVSFSVVAKNYILFWRKLTSVFLSKIYLIFIFDLFYDPIFLAVMV